MICSEQIRFYREEAEANKYRDPKYAETLLAIAHDIECKYKELRKNEMMDEKFRAEELKYNIDKYITSRFSQPRSLKGPPIDNE